MPSTPRRAQSGVPAAADRIKLLRLFLRCPLIHATVRIPTAVNEPVFNYAPGSPERAELKRTLERMSAERIEIPLVIGGKQVRTGHTHEVRVPHRHSHVLAVAHEAEATHVQQAIAAAQSARAEASAMPFPE